MSFSWTLFLSSLLALPSLCILLILLGLALLRFRPGWARACLAAGLGSLYFFSSGLGAGLLASGLESGALAPGRLEALQREGWQAIVVLGGGRELAAPEYGGVDMPNYWAASRLRYGAWAYRQSGLPLLLSGGVVHGERESEASLLGQSLIRDHVVQARWLESDSRTTWENAERSRQLLAAEGINRVVLVTTASHMPRATLAFRTAGFTVLPAPTDFTDFQHKPWPLQLIPSTTALQYSRQAVHEYLGLVWYHWKALWA